MGRNIWGMQVPEEYVWTPDNTVAVSDLAFDNSRQMIETGLDVMRPDVIIVMDSDAALLDAQNNAPKDVPLVVWGVDNHVRDYRRPYFDHYFLAHKSVSVMSWETIYVAGANVVNMPNSDMTWLPCGYDNVAFPPSPIAWGDREYDVACLGFMYPKRWQLVNAMKEAGLKVIAGCGMVYDQYRDLHHNARVALVSSACGDLPIRLFEGAGMGCWVLSDEIADLKLLDGGKGHIWTYSSVEDAVDKAESLTSTPPDIAKLNMSQQHTWAANHTWDKRAQVIIDWLEARK
jgi:hypothetical protein